MGRVLRHVELRLLAIAGIVVSPLHLLLTLALRAIGRRVGQLDKELRQGRDT